MTARLAPRTTRRHLLKLGAAALAAGLALPLTSWPAGAPGAPGAPALRIASALPLPGYDYLPFPERLLTPAADRPDLALVPAHVAALLVRHGLLQPLAGPPGRAHDPDGHYSVLHAYRVAALRFPNETTAPQSASWGDLWTAADHSAWPASGRLIVGAALLRRGYSPNDSHPGHLAQAAADLERLRPQLAPAGAEHFDGGQPGPRAPALVLADPAAIGQANGLRLPVEGTLLVEYDWVVLAGSERAALARQFVDQLPVAGVPRPDLPVRLIPLMPLSAAARAQHAAIWAALATRDTEAL